MLVQDCGKWMYLENYRSFFAAIKKRYPHMQLIADCDLSGQADEDLWDWHLYTNSYDMFNRSAGPRFFLTLAYVAVHANNVQLEVD